MMRLFILHPVAHMRADFPSNGIAMPAIVAVVNRFEHSYHQLGIAYERRPQIVANANHVLQVMRDCRPAANSEIDEAVERLAESDYAQHANRSPILLTAAMGGAFSPATSQPILSCDYDAGLADADIRNGLQLIDHAVKIPGLQKKFPDGTPTQFRRELAIVSAVCKEMSGFDPDAEISLHFRAAKMDFRPFREAYRSDPAFAAAVKNFIRRVES
jgi:hypothetical protein